MSKIHEQWIEDYLDRYKKAFEIDVKEQLLEFHQLCLEVQKAGRKLIMAGNGASASIASHAALDFSKQGKVKAVSFNDPSLITAYANDLGYENWVAKCLEMHAVQGDVAVLISSSGTSKNIVNAAQASKSLGLKVVGFSGFKQDNPLNSTADIGFWVDSRAYNVIENIHSIWMMCVVDMLVGQAEYTVS
jgi:D-sedoheptulose 7-phosphate isomerase